MILSNELTVGASVDHTWRALMDVQRVAACLPGARIEPVGEDGSYRGTLKLKVGPATMAYEGTVRLEDADDTDRSLSYYAAARDANGAGGATATIRTRLTALDGGTRTRLDVETDLSVTGRAAQFGRGITQGVAAKMLGSFATELERMINQGESAEPESPVGVAGETQLRDAPAAAPAQDVFDLGGALSSLASPRAVAVAAAALALAYLAGRRQRTVRVIIVRSPR